MEIVPNEIQVLASLDFQADTFWDFYIGDNYLMKYKVQTVGIEFPTLTMGEKTVTGHSFYQKVKYPDSITIKVNETSDWETFAYCWEWLNKIFDFKRRLYRKVKASDLYKTGYVYFTSGFFTTNKKIILEELRPIGISKIDLSRDATGKPLQLDFQVVYNNINFTDIDPLNILSGVKDVAKNLRDKANSTLKSTLGI